MAIYFALPPAVTSEACQALSQVGVPEGTIKARLSRGRAALAALLDDSGTQEGATRV